MVQLLKLGKKITRHTHYQRTKDSVPKTAVLKKAPHTSHEYYYLAHGCSSLNAPSATSLYFVEHNSSVSLNYSSCKEKF